MDSIKITITRGCDESGKGGDIVDEATAVLGSLPDGASVLDTTIAAFASSYPIPTIPAEKDGDPPIPTMSAYRNFSYRLRVFANEVVGGFASARASKLAAEQATEQIKKTLESVTVIESI